MHCFLTSSEGELISSESNPFSLDICTWNCLDLGTLAWKIPWMEEPGRLQSMGSLSRTRLSNFTFPFHFHALEKEMATHSSVLAWRIPGMGEPGGLPSVGSCRVGHDWSDSAAAADMLCFSHIGNMPLATHWKHLGILSNYWCLDYTPSRATKITKSNNIREFPGGPVVKNLLSSAGDAGSFPGKGAEFPYAMRRLSSRTATKTQHSQVNKYFLKY